MAAKKIDDPVGEGQAKIPALETEAARELMKLLEENPAPLEYLAADEIETIRQAGRVLAAKSEAYYLGYLSGRVGAGGEVADAGVTIVAATAGSAVGTVVGQIVGKKISSEVLVREELINPALFRTEALRG